MRDGAAGAAPDQSEVKPVAVMPEMTVVTIDDLESFMGEKRLMVKAAAQEKLFSDQLESLARQASDPRIRAVLISGPTASGKTTTTHRLEDLLTGLGRRPVVLSLDDYYGTDAIDYDSEGRPDYESLNTLAVDLIAHDIPALMRGEPVLTPTFDFKTRSRRFDVGKSRQLEPNGILLVEGLHALAAEIADPLPADQCLRIFLMPYGALHLDRQLLDSRDIRILRRIARDVSHRGSTALATIDYWPMLDQTEREIFPPYLAKADVMVNTALPYEFLVVAPAARASIEESLREYDEGRLPGSVYHREAGGYANLTLALKEARRLEAAIRHIPAAPPIFVPPTSILHEFIS